MHHCRPARVKARYPQDGRPSRRPPAPHASPRHGAAPAPPPCGRRALGRAIWSGLAVRHGQRQREEWRHCKDRSISIPGPWSAARDHCRGGRGDPARVKGGLASAPWQQTRMKYSVFSERTLRSEMRNTVRGSDKSCLARLVWPALLLSIRKGDTFSTRFTSPLSHCSCWALLRVRWRYTEESIP